MSLPDSPVTRGEQYLNRAATGSGDLPDAPMTRIEQYLAKIAGEDVELPAEAYTRIEQYLKEIAENGSGSGGGGGGGGLSYETSATFNVAVGDDATNIETFVNAHLPTNGYILGAVVDGAAWYVGGMPTSAGGGGGSTSTTTSLYMSNTGTTNYAMLKWGGSSKTLVNVNSNILGKDFHLVAVKVV